MFPLAATALALAAFALPGCLPHSQYMEQQSRLDELRDDVQRLKRSVDEINAAQAARPAPDETIGPRLAQLGERVEQMDRDVQALKGKSEELDRTVTNLVQLSQAKDSGAVAVTPLRAELKDMGVRLDALSRRVAELAKAAPAPAAEGAPPAAEKPAEQAGQKAEENASPKELYEAAYALYREGKFEVSQEKFRDYIRRFPNTQLTDNAYFWIGEAYYDQGKYEQAILQYDKVMQGFPDSDKLVSALLKQAFSFAALGDNQDAKILLRKIIQEYPNSEQAPIAKKKMEILGN